MKTQSRTDLSAYRSDGFIGKYQKLIKDVVIPYQYRILCDEEPDAAKSHVVQNFINAGMVNRGEGCGDGFYGEVFQDSDAGKWLEAVAYSLTGFPDEELEKTADSLIDKIAEAQEPDGYLDTHFTINNRERRWTNLLEAHELYCAGHLMEAACAYYEATGKDKLLNVMLKNAEHIYDRFIVQKNEGYPGHPEIELALLKMYRLTGNKHCLELCEHFINTRGVNADFYKEEAAKRDWSVWGGDGGGGEYRQSHKPVREQEDAIGHSVRAAYLYTAMADLASENNDKTLYDACKRLWHSITQKRMYITGAIGSTIHGEAFWTDYDLPSDTAYAETCASIGLMFFASRMLENEVKGEYADVMETAFYNTVLAGMQLDGKRFFYVNPLEVIPGISGSSPTHRHDLPERPKWYSCACCPPNVARLIPSLGQYAYGESRDTAFCHLYAGGSIKFKNGMSFTCKTDYPYGFDVTYDIEKGGRLAVRIPSWSKKYGIKLCGKETEPDIKDGYAYIDVADGDVLTLTLDGTPRFAYANTKIPQLSGKTAICRGPLVYCFEGVDNSGDVLSMALKAGSEVNVSEYDESLLCGTTKLTAKAVRLTADDTLYSFNAPQKTECEAVGVPYYTWGNRGINQMRVWMDME